MRHLTAILVLMTVLLASISCGGAGEGTIPGNGDLQPITEAQPETTRAETASNGEEPGTTGGEPVTTGGEPAPETRREKTPGDEGYREANPETNPEANLETGERTLPGEVVDKPGTETKGSMGRRPPDGRRNQKRGRRGSHREFPTVTRLAQKTCPDGTQGRRGGRQPAMARIPGLRRGVPWTAHPRHQPDATGK